MYAIGTIVNAETALACAHGYTPAAKSHHAAFGKGGSGLKGRPAEPQAKIQGSMGMAVNVLARQAAIKATKRQLLAQGLGPTHLSHRELVIRAEQYLAEHRAELALA